MLADLNLERFTLENGLEVILHQDHTLPIAAVNLWYHVGSKDEAPGLSGFAHLFEHLMFMGTKRVPNADFDRILEQGGGSNNASTSRDRTNFFAWGPRELLPTLLWLEADRMEALGASMTQEKLDLQRDVVRNERRQSYENRPYGKSWLLLSRLLYPSGHPYHMPVIGSHEDLMAASVEDVRQFFETWYHPGNASLVVAGDFPLEATRDLVRKLFEDIPAGPEPPRKGLPGKLLPHRTARSLHDQVPAPRTLLAWHTPVHFAPGDAELDLVADLLGQGAASRLQQALIHKRRLCQDVSVFHQSGRLGSALQVMATTLPGVSLDEVEAIILEEVERLRSEGPRESELARLVTSAEVVFLHTQESLLGRADLLNLYNAARGVPDSRAWDLERYRQATPGALKDWSGRLLTPAGLLVLRTLPEEIGSKPQARPGASRESCPAPGIKGTFTPPRPQVSTLKNGPELWLLTRQAPPLLTLHVLADGGCSLDPPGKEGRESLFTALLEESAGDRDPAALDAALEALGADLGCNALRRHVDLRMSSLSRTAQQSLNILEDVIFRPRFLPEDFERCKALRLAALKERRSQPGKVAALVARRMLFGRGHPLGQPPGGFERSVLTITLPELTARHEVWQAALPEARLVLAGDLQPEKARDLAEGLLAALSTDGLHQPPAPPPLPKEPPSLEIYLVPRPKAPQTVIRYLSLAEPLSSPLTPAFWVTNALFGGTFTSRLNMNLRERHGFTYGASSAFLQDSELGLFTAATSVRSETTGEALKEFLGEFARIREGGITEKELVKARATQHTQGIKAFESLAGTAGVFCQAAAGRLAPTIIPALYAALGEVSVADCERVAARYLQGTSGVLVLVGDRELILKHLGGLDLPQPSLVDEEGEPL